MLPQAFRKSRFSSHSRINFVVYIIRFSTLNIHSNLNVTFHLIISSFANHFLLLKFYKLFWESLSFVEFLPIAVTALARLACKLF